MVLTANATSGAAPPFAFALEAELRPIEADIARLRRSERVEQTRTAVRGAMQRIVFLARSAERADVVEFAAGLNAYLDCDPWTKTSDSFDDAQVVCATVDVLNAKLPGASGNVAELEAYLRERFQARIAAASGLDKPVGAMAADLAVVAPTTEEPKADISICEPQSDALAPWTAVDEAMERAWEAELTNEDLYSDEPPVMSVEIDESPADEAPADEVDQMIAEAFPEAVVETPAVESPLVGSPVADAQGSPESRRSKSKRDRKAKNKAKEEKKPRDRSRRKKYQVEPGTTAAGAVQEPVTFESPIAEEETFGQAGGVVESPAATDEDAAEKADAELEHMIAEAFPEAVPSEPEAQATETVEEPLPIEAVADIPLSEAPAPETTEPVVETSPVEAVVETSIPETAEIVAETPAVAEVPFLETVESVPEAPKEPAKKSKRGRNGKKKEVSPVAAIAQPVEETPVADAQGSPEPETTIAASLVAPEPTFAAPTSPSDSILDRTPHSSVLDAWDLTTADRDAWLEEHHELLGRLRTSLNAVKADPASTDAMLDLAYAIDEYKNAALRTGRPSAAEFAAKLEKLPWKLAERHSSAPAEVVDLFRNGVRALIDLATGFYDPTQVQALVAAVDAQLADPAAVKSTPDVEAVETPVADAQGSLEAPFAGTPQTGLSSRNLLALFETETAELLGVLEGAVTALAANPKDADALDKAFITAHTFVGASATVGFTDGSRVAGHLESILERIQAGSGAWNAEAHSLLYLGIELLRQRRAEHPLAAFAVASYSEQCAAWSAAQDAAAQTDYVPPPVEVETASFEDEPSSAEIDPNASAVGAAFDLLAGVSDHELDLGDVPAELLEVYTEEAEEHLKLINAGLDRLRTEPSNRDLVQEVRRSAHTLKGAAGAVGLRAVAKLAHRMEDLLDQLYEGDRVVGPDVYDLLRRSTDLLGDLSSGVRKPETAKDSLNGLFARYQTIINRAEVAAEETVAAEEAVPTETPEAAEIVATVEPTPAAEVQTSPEIEQEAKQPTLPARQETRPTEVAIWPPTPAPSAIRTPTTPTQREDQHQTRRTGNMLRVPLERIDDLVRLVSELVINRTAFEQRMADFVRLVEDLKGSSSRLRNTSVELQNEYEATAHRTGRVDPFASIQQSMIGDARFAFDFDALEFDRYTDFHLLTRALAESTGDVGTLSSELANLVGEFDALLNRQSRLSRAIQDRLMRTRMVALSSLASRLERTVRTAADSLGKKVDLELRGDATELDKTVLEEMIDPLLHLLRNCVDHGLEREDERRSAGKPGEGRIFIHAFYQGTQVVIQVGDDGRGIEPERLRTAAVRGGFLSPADAADADLEALHQLLFMPGFTTAGEVSEISGRGVGLDIVRSRVAKLKGSIAVDSTVGKGTTFSIRLPMTLAIVRSLLVSAHGKTFAIPIQAVSQIIRVEKSAIGKVADGRVIFHGGRVFSLFQLGKTLALPSLTEDEPAVMPVLITYSGSREVAVQVDKIVAAREIVVKTLGTHLRRVHGMIGATVMGDGAVVPILNLPELYAKVRSESSHPIKPRMLPKSVEALKVMIVDDSVSVRRVVSTMIKSQGWTPIQAKDGLDAFEQLQRSATAPDAILLDVEMPRMSGYELLAALRSQEKFLGVPIVMVTSRAGEKHRRKAMELGANEYTVKPFLEDALVSLLRKLVAVPAATA